LPKSYRETISKNINHHIADENFKDRSRNGSDGAFKRDRKLPFEKLMVSIMTLGKSSIQREMDGFFKEVNSSAFNTREITKSAFSQSRRQLKPDSFLEINDIICEGFYSQAPYLGYRRHRVLAIDGSRLQLPKSKDIADVFGSMTCGAKLEIQRSMALTSFLYDAGNLLTLDVQIRGCDGDEREMALEHFEKTKPGDLLLMDRGYPSKAIFSILASKGVDFCIRMKENWWLDVKAFAQSSKLEMEVEYELSKKVFDEYKVRYPKMRKKVKCRLVKVFLEGSATEIVCTSLLDKVEYPACEFKDLYHLRWNEEEAYKLFKARIGIEAFTGKTAISVKQDILAKATMLTLCAAFSFPIEQKVTAAYETNNTSFKFAQKINRTGAYANIRSIAVVLFIKRKVKKAIEAFDSIVEATREIIRPGRSNERNHKTKRPYNMNYKNV
jgi:hypothetical protein